MIGTATQRKATARVKTRKLGAFPCRLLRGRTSAAAALVTPRLHHPQLVRNIARIRHLPAVIVQGRYDVICPPATAWRLHQAWPEARLHMVEDAGHAAFEPGTEAALVAATNQFRDQRQFRRSHGA